MAFSHLAAVLYRVGNDLPHPPMRATCAWRAKIAEESRQVIEAATARALSGAMGPNGSAAPSLDELEKFDFSEETFDDPLGIAMSWEDKYGKKKKAADEGKP